MTPQSRPSSCSLATQDSATAGPPPTRLKGVLVWPMKKFQKHLIFYRPLSDGVEILHVFHGARDLPATLEAEEDDDT